VDKAAIFIYLMRMSTHNMTMHANTIRFAKMHGLGNDFVIIHSTEASWRMTPSRISQLADRHQGIGFDQLLTIEPSQQADFLCRIFNADGSEAEQCGNGMRCIARYIHEQGLSSQSSFSVQTKAGIYILSIENYNRIRVTMGPPTIKQTQVELQLPQDLGTVTMSIIHMGNPHAIVRVQDMHVTQTLTLGRAISTHAYFPQGTNVGFMQIIDQHHIVLRTFERGSGPTFSCGSNACAAAVIGITQGWLTSRVIVEFCYGSLEVEWEGNEQPVYVTGPATYVFSGEILAASMPCMITK
jgi:diaminopimelate epimerase